MVLTLEDIEKDVSDVSENFVFSFDMLAFLRPFTHANFDVAAHVTSLLSSTTPSLNLLSNSISSIEQQIHSNVTVHHGDLLAQTTNVEVMENVVQNCSKRANACLNSMDKLKSKLEGLYDKCNSQVEYLEHLYIANKALRRVAAVLEIDRKAENERNTADVATCVVQIEYLCNGTPKLSFLQPFADKTASLRQNIEKQTENMLNQGLTAKAMVQVSSSLQIFVNLNVLEQKVAKIFAETEKAIERDVSASLKVKLQAPAARGGGPGRAIFPTSSVAVAQIWSNLDTLTGKIVIQTSKVKLLWKSIMNGKDSTSNLSFATFFNADESWQKFWNNFMDILIRYFAAVNLEFVKQAFENELPRLLNVFSTMASKIEEGSENLSVQPGLRGVISNYEKAFLSKSLAKLFDSVNHTFSSVPTSNDLGTILKLIKTEMQVDDPILKKLVGRNVGKMVHLVCVRAEQLITNDGNATQVIGPPTDSQISNAQVLNSLEYFKGGLSEPDEGIDILMKNSINPLIQAISDAVEAILQTIHNENFRRTNRATEYSLYMGELQSFISRAAKDYFSLYKSTDLVQQSGITLASRTIELFTRHVSLLSSLNQEATKSQIIIDLNHLEIVLTPICPVLSELGKPYKLLKGFKSLLTMGKENIVASNLVGSVVSYSLVTHLMFMFDHGDLKLPHVVNNWSITRYSKWLDEHKPESERLNMLKTCVESYVQNVTQKGQQEFAPVYPHLMALLQKGLLNS